MEYKTITVEYRKSLHLIRINRPETANRLSIICMEELEQELKRASKMDSCRAVVLYG